ncbi:hypothetical protein CRV01_08545 [Arcobacter sp. CECT 8983]|uniref:hypothetical protein n=1 Tax=Arcobacter sp. CECT 8983 TaxID=2044508 RepID=UPI00100B1959|nr:hypothetical protein [Arcobacter sp. CECT 8983]RXJ89514.1 hypothetical protein CRV01_08545 [Arcobacter sp. CECT 8983]
MKKTISLLSVCTIIFFSGCAKINEDIMIENTPEKQALILNQSCEIKLNKLSEEVLPNGSIRYGALHKGQYINMTLNTFKYDSSRYYLDSEGYFKILRKNGFKIKRKEVKGELYLVEFSNSIVKHLATRGLSSFIVLTSTSHSFFDIIKKQCITNKN